MTPKEKAKQLYKKMKFETQFNSQPSTVHEMCKKVALICVNEQLELINLINNDGADDYYEEILQIKEEIEKL